jgi:hypothetical protein
MTDKTLPIIINQRKTIKLQWFHEIKNFLFN